MYVKRIKHLHIFLVFQPNLPNLPAVPNFLQPWTKAPGKSKVPIKCTFENCSVQVGYISSLARHLREKHNCTEEEADKLSSEVSKKLLGEDAEKLEEPKLCCNSTFNYKLSFKKHMQEKHGNQEQSRKAVDRYKESVHCPKCTPGTTRQFTRRSYLLKHLMSSIHKLGKEEAECYL